MTTTAAGLRLEDYWPGGAPPCAVCGGVLGSGYGGWVASGGSVREHRADAQRYGDGDLLLAGASDAGTGWTPICSDLCARFAFEVGPGRVLTRPAPIEGTLEVIEPSWDGPCTVCGCEADTSDDSDPDWGPLASHWMSVNEYRVTRTRAEDHLRSEAADDSWVDLCSDACERAAFPEDFADEPDQQDEQDAPVTARSSGLLPVGAALVADHANAGRAPASFRRAARAGAATLTVTVTRWCHTRLVGKGS